MEKKKSGTCGKIEKLREIKVENFGEKNSPIRITHRRFFSPSISSPPGKERGESAFFGVALPTREIDLADRFGTALPLLGRSTRD